MSNLVQKPNRDPFLAMREEMDQVFNHWFPMQWGNGRNLLAKSFPLSASAPALDVEEDGNEIRVRAELPGVEKDDFKIDVDGNRLTIRGEKKTSKEEKKKDYVYTECSYGSFERSLTLPCEVNADKAEAVLKNGVLNLRLPKAEVSKARHVPVKVS